MNVVFIVLDTVRRDFISPFNEDVEFTENIESLANEGTVFNQTVSQAPWTLPSHSSMFTGMYPWEHGATQTNFDLEVEEDLLAEKLRDQGYSTASFSANPFISDKFGTVDGFERTETTVGLVDLGINKKLGKAVKSFEEKFDFGAIPFLEQLGSRLSYKIKLIGENDTEKLVGDAKEYIRENKDDDFFVFMNLMDCHLPLLPEKEYKEKHAPEVDMNEINQYPHRVVHSEDKEPDEDALKKLYSAEIDYLDDQIGEMMSFIESEGLEEETVFVLASDHGENLGEDGLMGHFFTVNENLVNVPLIIRSPDMESKTVEKQVELRELHDIILEQTGIIDEYEIGVEHAKGGEDRPEMDLAKTPSDKKEKYDEEKYFIRTRGEKGIITSKGEFKKIDLTEEDKMRRSVLKKKLEGLEGAYSESKDGRKVESVDEEVKNELEKLGYIQND